MDDVCRICRGDATPEEPLYHPCRCSGSIRYVHEDCLLEWLRHSRRATTCELCRHRYAFENQYRASMPRRLPMTVYLRHLSAKAWLVGRFVGLVAGLAMVVKYTVELGTLGGRTNWLSRDPVGRMLATLVTRIASPTRQPYVPFLHLGPKWRPIVREIWVAVIDGILLLVALALAVVLLWLLAAWTVTDERLLHDLDHIAHGEPGHIDHGDIDGDYILDYDDPPDDWVDEPDVDAPVDAGQAADAANQEANANIAEPLNANRGRNVAERNNEAVVGPPPNAWAGAAVGDDFEDFDGDFRDTELWTTIGNILSGPTPEIAKEFACVCGMAMFVLVVAYQIPYMCGWMMLNGCALVLQSIFMALGWDATRIPVGEWPESVGMHVSIVLGALSVGITTARMAELRWLDRLLQSNEGRVFVSNFLQAFAVVKCICVVLVEILVFPEFCGVLLHVCLLPVLPPGSMAFALAHPTVLLTTQWLLGFAYMWVLNRFVAAARACFRPGTLYFAQDTSDPNFELLRIIITHPLNLQFKRILMSAGVYSALIAVGIGAVVAAVARAFPFVVLRNMGYWPGWDLLRLWPLWVPAHMLYSRWPQVMTALEQWWVQDLWAPVLERGCRALSLGPWMLGDPLPDPDSAIAKSGTYLRAPGVDSWPCRRGMRLFVPVTATDERLDGLHGVQDNELHDYVVVHRPRMFWPRIGVLLAFMWATGSVLILMAAIPPLIIGRTLDWALVAAPLRNDLILWTVGATLCLALWARMRLVVPIVLQLPNNSLTSESGVQRIACTLVAAVVQPMIMRGSTAPTNSTAVNFMLVWLGVRYRVSRFTAWPFEVLSLLQLAMPSSQPPLGWAQTLFVIAQYGVMVDRWRTVPVVEWLGKWSQTIRDTYYLEGKHLQNYDEPGSSAEPVAQAESLS